MAADKPSPPGPIAPVHHIVRPHASQEAHGGAIAFTLVAAVLMTGLIGFGAREMVRTAAETDRQVKATATARPTEAIRIAPPAADRLGATLIRGATPPVIWIGQETTLVYLFRNTGTASWVRGTPAEARLGIVGDDTQLADLGMDIEWLLPTRPAVQLERIVAPGNTAQFSFRVKGTEPGRYQLQVAPVVDGVTWMEAAAPLDITVR